MWGHTEAASMAFQTIEMNWELGKQFELRNGVRSVQKYIHASKDLDWLWQVASILNVWIRSEEKHAVCYAMCYISYCGYF